MDILSIDKQTLGAQESQLTSHLNSIRTEVKIKVEAITKQSFNIISFHGQIGGKNAEFVDITKVKFTNAEHFIDIWVENLIKAATKKRDSGTYDKEPYKSGEYRLIQYLNDPLIRDYIFTFLTRNFYRNYKERIREKPPENLCSIWFGSGYSCWGLLIEPVLKNGSWINDKSAIRRANYNYWTIGHVMKIGLIKSSDNQLIKFEGIQKFMNFYTDLITKTSQSPYEREICYRYINYLNKSQNILLEPLLIPEFRFEGKEINHKYRLDYTILNPYLMKMTGFEISPASTHMSVQEIENRSQREINGELSKKWSKESDKRNSYFDKYGIFTITFTDKDLKDKDKCFKIMERCLKEKSSHSNSLQAITSKLEAFNNHNI